MGPKESAFIHHTIFKPPYHDSIGAVGDLHITIKSKPSGSSGGGAIIWRGNVDPQTRAITARAGFQAFADLDLLQRGTLDAVAKEAQKEWDTIYGTTYSAVATMPSKPYKSEKEKADEIAAISAAKKAETLAKKTAAADALEALPAKEKAIEKLKTQITLIASYYQKAAIGGKKGPGYAKMAEDAILIAGMDVEAGGLTVAELGTLVYETITSKAIGADIKDAIVDGLAKSVKAPGSPKSPSSVISGDPF